LELVLTPRGAKIRQIPHNRPLCLRGLLGTGSVRAETCMFGCDALPIKHAAAEE
jgi:hypothetical protein